MKKQYILIINLGKERKHIVLQIFSSPEDALKFGMMSIDFGMLRNIKQRPKKEQLIVYELVKCNN